MAWTRYNRMISFICSLFVNFVKLFKFFGIKVSEYHVNFNAGNEERRIEMGPLSNNSVLSPARHQTGQPTVDGLNAGFDGNVANEVHRAGAEIITPQQTERATILEPSFQLDQSRPTQTIDQDETFKSGVKVAFWATSISASGVTAVWTQFPVNQPISPKCKFFAKAALLSMSASFISGLLIFILSFIRPKFDATAMMVKILMFAAIGSTALVVGFGVVFYFEKSG
ncbi:hypothetical protein CKAN_02035800 [Cinnamomum micranthum f. kanehirae]|uniref:Uncharacterized protein n=1 Tax=Cinnamomum micranthum f. kanehirae TaxID=337451 RepID=A0A443PKE7_9MAGN|nr:hypothetical protein CKAN_02035800 [Cinnamomum micranthum f. kanehirae]